MWHTSSRISNLHFGRFMVAKLGVKDCLNILSNRIFSVNHYYMLKRSLSQSIEVQRPRLPVVIRHADDDDMVKAANAIECFDADSQREFLSRLFFYRTGTKQCYIVTTKKGEAAYLQWLIYPTENDKIKKQFRGIFSLLNENQVLVENVFTFPKFRGHGLMAHVTAELLNIARDAGYKTAIMYIRKDRIESLSQAIKLGFKITTLLKEYKILGTTRRVPFPQFKPHQGARR